MPSAIIAPTQITARELDNYLARGWRPLGQRIYTADFIQLELGEIFSVIPTRLPLEQHKWKKRQRKLLRKNTALFEVVFRPAVIDDEKQKVNDQYLLEHPTKSTTELEIHTAFDGRRIFETMECAIYLDDQLVAFSFFDCGESSVYSKAGIYDPAFKDYSLGIFSMLLEIKWCQENGLKYYYPGYISPDIPLFDYKSKIGQIEFWNLQKQAWLPFNIYDKAKHGPLQVLLQQDAALQQELEKADFEAPEYQYVFFEMQMMQKGAYKLLEQPFFLLLHFPEPQAAWIAVYNLELACYECWHCKFDRMITFFEPVPSGRDLFHYVLELRRLLFRVENVTLFSLKFQQLLLPENQQVQSH